MTRIKTKTKRLSNQKKLVVLTSSIFAMTAVGLSIYLLSSKSAKASSIGKDVVTKPKRPKSNTNVSTQTTTSQTTSTTSQGQPSIITITNENKTDMTTIPTNTRPVSQISVQQNNRSKLAQATQNTLARAYDEYLKNVRDPEPNTILDRQGVLYDCSYNRIGSFPQGVRIFNYLQEGVGVNRDYYSNSDSGPCAANKYYWCGAFVAYCWNEVQPYYRSSFFPGVSSLMRWGDQNPARYVDFHEIRPGDIFLIAKEGASRGHHIALCYEVLGNGVFKTIEGNTYGDGQLEGVCYRTRHLENSPSRASGKNYVIKALRPLETDLI